MSKLRMHTRKNLQKVRAEVRREFEARIIAKRGGRPKPSKQKAEIPAPWEAKKRWGSAT